MERGNTSDYQKAQKGKREGKIRVGKRGGHEPAVIGWVGPGMLFYTKIVGAYLEQGGDVEHAVELFQRVRDNTRTYSVAFTQCTHPVTGMQIVNLPENEIEMGMGVHGEGGGNNRIPMPTSAQLAQKVGDILLKDGPYGAGEEVLLFINELLRKLFDNPGTERCICLAV